MINCGEIDYNLQQIKLLDETHVKLALDVIKKSMV